MEILTIAGNKNTNLKDFLTKQSPSKIPYKILGSDITE